MFTNLLAQLHSQRLVIIETTKQIHPVVQFIRALLFQAFVEFLQNRNQTVLNKCEVGLAHQDHNNAQNLLKVVNRVVISISASAECYQRVVAHSDETVKVKIRRWFFIDILFTKPFGNEVNIGVTGYYYLCCNNQIENTCTEIRCYDYL